MPYPKVPLAAITGFDEFNPGKLHTHVCFHGWVPLAARLRTAVCARGVRLWDTRHLQAGFNDCVRMRPTEAEGWFTPRSEANVAAISTGSTRP